MGRVYAVPRPPHVKPTIFEEYFGLGGEEIASPFLTPSSRKWGANLTLKASLIAFVLLAFAFLFSFFSFGTSFSYFLLVFVYFLAGIPALIESIEDLAEWDVNIDVLMTIAAFSSVLIGSSMEGALLLVLFALSGSIEDAVTAKAKGSLNRLHRLSPTKATLIDEKGRLLERSVKDISVGAAILVKAGEIVPLDGIIKEGISSVNLVHLTGESLPVMKKKGDTVAAGARNLEGSLTIQVTHTSADSTMTRIIQLVTEAHEARPRLQRWFDRLSRAYALSIISLAAFFALALHFVLGLSFFGTEGSLYRALAFLIAASPCALILALPIAYLSAISACARQGILLKGGVTLDALADCTVIAFDKTGTLTTGNLTCTGIQPLQPDNREEKEILSIAYALEKNATHPIAKAVTLYATEKQASLDFKAENFQSIPGFGVESLIHFSNGTIVSAYMGHPAYISKHLSPEAQEALQKRIQVLQKGSQLLSVLKINQEIYLFSFEDQPRIGIKETIQRLKNRGIWKLIMLTGDHENSARRIANEVGIEQFYAGLKPENKLDYVTLLSDEEGLAMVGDGVNDAPALARASVGICMGKVGSDTAIDAADVVLLHDNLEKLDWLMLKGKQTTHIVRQNLTIAVGAILIASFPALAGLVPLWLAVLMHEGGTVLVGLNALRLLR